MDFNFGNFFTLFATFIVPFIYVVFRHFLKNRMSESEITLEEELSPDLFSDIELSQSTNNVNSDCKNLPCILSTLPLALSLMLESLVSASSMSIGVNEPEPDNDDEPAWKGMSMDEIRRGLGVYEHREHPPIVVSPRHTVLFMVRFYIIHTK